MVALCCLARQAQKKIHATAGAFANPETLINQARKIDVYVLAQLREFTAYPAKDF